MADARQDIVELLPQLRGFARTLCSGDNALADDLVQDTVVLALRAWNSFTPGTSLRSWLLKILHNRFHSLKRRKFQSAEIARDDLDMLASVPPTQDSRLEVAAFKRAFAQLKPEHRNVLVLSVVHGEPYESIAATIGCRVGTVKSRISRARGQLKELMLGGANGAVRPPTIGAAPPRRRPARALAAPIAVPRTLLTAPTAVAPGRILVVNAERQIVQTELMLTRYRRISDRLARTPVGVAWLEPMLDRLGSQLSSLNAYRERLLHEGAARGASWPPGF